MFKKIFFVIIFLTCIYLTKVNALTITPYNGKIYTDRYINGIYIKMVKPSGWSKYLTAQMIKRSSDNAFVYCLEPYIIVNDQSKYHIYNTDYANLLKISPATWERINRLAYYGYGYSKDNINHQADKWWIITQMLIWQSIEPTSQFYYTKTLNGPKDSNKFKTEISELENLVANHQETPHFNVPTKIVKGSTITLNDTNKLLTNFNYANSSNIKVTKQNNTITITALNTGQAFINFNKINYYKQNPVLYFASDSQKVMSVGNTPNVTSKINFSIIEPQIIVKKVDSETITPQGQAKLINAKYGIYYKNGKKLTTITISDNQTATFNNFKELGEYYLQEEQASEGYNLDPTKYYFEITENNYLINLEVKEKVIKGQIKIYKKDLTTNQPSSSFIGATYEITNSQNKVVDTLIINEDSFAISKFLPYGTYYIKETIPPTGYNLDPKTYKVEITKHNQIYEVTSYDEQIKGQIKIYKKDLTTNHPSSSFIGATYEIINSQNKVVDTLIINEDSFAISKFLPYGTYYIKETIPPTGYNLDPKTYKVEITKHNQIYEVTSCDEQIKGQIKIYKKDLTTNQKSSSFVGATYEITNSQNKVVDTLIINEDSFAISKFLPYGTYYIKETIPPTGYNLDPKTYKIKINKHNQIYEVTSYDEQIKGQIKIYKKDLTTNQPSSSFVGATYEIANFQNKVVDTLIINEGSFAISKFLPYGTYYIKETIPPTGYNLDPKTYKIKINNHNQIYEITSCDEKIYGSIELLKIDATTSKPISNTEFALYDTNNNLLGKYITDCQGKIFIGNLPYGTYYLVETKSNPNYILNNQKIKINIKNHQQIITKKVTNSRKIIEVPETSKNILVSNISLLILGLVICALSSKKI